MGLTVKRTFECYLILPLVKLCNYPSTGEPSESKITSSPGPNTSDLSMLNLKVVDLPTGQPGSSTAAVVTLNERPPFEEKMAEFSTPESPDTQMESSTFNLHTDQMSKSQSEILSSGFDNDAIPSINATETSPFDFLNGTVSPSAEPGLVETSATAETLETSSSPPEPEYNSNSSTQPMGKPEMITLVSQ